MITPLARRLDRWVKQGLISPEQAQAISQFEKGAGSRSWVVFGVVGIGVTAIATGVISLVAANWDNIPVLVKLLGYGLIQVGAGVLFLREERREGVWREAFLALFVLLFWAGIGLFAQIFNLAGNGWTACLFWLAISLPAIALSRHGYLPNAWTVGLELTAFWWVMQRHNPIRNETMRIMIGASVPLLLAGISFWAQSINLMSAHFRTAFNLWGVGVFAIGGTILGDMLWEARNHKVRFDEVEYLAIPWVTLAVAVVGSLVRKNRPKNIRIGTALLLLMVGVFATTPLLFNNSGAKILNQLLGATGFIFIASFGAYLAAIDHQKRLYEIASQLIAIRFIVVYFQVFGTLGTTGIGLIVSGLVILGVAYFWNRLKKSLFAKIGSDRGQP